MKIIITTESTLDLPKDLIDKNNISVMDANDILNSKRNKVNVYERFFKQQLQKCDCIIHIAFSSSLSKLFESARNAAEQINAEMGGKVFVVDSFCAGAGQGLLALNAAKLVQQGTSLEDALVLIDKEKMKINHIFTAQNLKNVRQWSVLRNLLVRIGRFLCIKPIFKVSNNGMLVYDGTKMFRKQSLLELAKDFIINNHGTECIISHANRLNDAIYLSKIIKTNTGVIPVITNLSSSIGVGVNHGAISVCFVGAQR